MNSLSRGYLQSLRDMFEVHIEDNTSDVIGNKDRISQIKEKKITLDDILRDWEGEDLSAYVKIIVNDGGEDIYISVSDGKYGFPLTRIDDIDTEKVKEYSTDYSVSDFSNYCHVK